MMTLVIKGLFVTLSIIDTGHNDALHYAECRILYIVMLIVVAPEKGPFEPKYPLASLCSLLSMQNHQNLLFNVALL